MVYFLIEDIEYGFIKVGNSDNLYGPSGRLGKLQEGNPRKLCVLATIPADKPHSTALEKQIKKELFCFQVRGEWYEWDRDLFEYIRRIEGIQLQKYVPSWSDSYDFWDPEFWMF